MFYIFFGDIYYSKKLKILNFFKIVALFLLKIETAKMIKYHQKKALFMGKKGRKFCLGATLHDRAIVIQSVTVLKAEILPGQEGGMCAQ